MVILPAVHIYIAGGRTEEQRRILAERVTEAVIETIKPMSLVELFIHRLPLENVVVSGWRGYVSSITLI